MRTSKLISCIDTHTEGMPTRIVIGGLPPIIGKTMSEKRTYFMNKLGHLREMIMREPRGHSCMFGAVLTEACSDDADWGVLYIDGSSVLPMCGHGTIGVSTMLVETGRVEITEPITTIRLDTAAGIVVASVEVENGHAKAVTFQNVPAFVTQRDETVDVPGLGLIRYDMVYGGNFYAIVNAADLDIVIGPDSAQELVKHGLEIIYAINASKPPTHPLDASITGLITTQFVQDGDDESDARNAIIALPGYFDRSPCGTGTCSQMALRYLEGKLSPGEKFVNKSIIGTRFEGKIVGETKVAALDAIIPTITGRAWLTGYSQHYLDDTDPFPSGFVA